MPPIPISKPYIPFSDMPSRHSNKQNTQDNDIETAATTLPLSPETPSPGVLKAVREYEHGRKSSKKRADTKGRQAHKAHCADRLAVSGLSCRYCRHPSASSEYRPKMMYAKGVHLSLVDSDVPEDAQDVAEGDWVAAAESKPETVEISLAELLKPAKPRAARHKAVDFELIPRVRSVVVLGDAVSLEPEVDEPWECVDWDKDELGRLICADQPTYAKVLMSDL